MATRFQLLLAVGLCSLWTSPAAAESAEATASDASASMAVADPTSATDVTVAGEAASNLSISPVSAAANTAGVSAAALTNAEGAEPASTGTAHPSIYSMSAAASTAAASEGSTSGWEFAVTTYLWASAMKVDVETPQGEDIKVDESFIDILDILKFAFMGALDVKHGRFVSVQDLMFIHTNSSADGHIGPIPLEADADMKMLSTTHLFGYRVLDDGPMFVDLFAGVRITTIKVGLDISGPLQTIERDAKKTQFGPVIASRFHAPLGGKWGTAIYGDIGGFGVGADLSWQLLGTIQYNLSERWRLAAGWRHFSAKQSNKGFDVHMRLDGPILGATYRF